MSPRAPTRAPRAPRSRPTPGFESLRSGSLAGWPFGGTLGPCAPGAPWVRPGRARLGSARLGAASWRPARLLFPQPWGTRTPAGGLESLSWKFPVAFSSPGATFLGSSGETGCAPDCLAGLGGRWVSGARVARAVCLRLGAPVFEPSLCLRVVLGPRISLGIVPHQFVPHL